MINLVNRAFYAHSVGMSRKQLFNIGNLINELQYILLMKGD